MRQYLDRGLFGWRHAAKSSYLSVSRVVVVFLFLFVLLIFLVVSLVLGRRVMCVAFSVGMVVTPLELLACIFLALHASLGELLHHFDELLAIVFQEIVRHR